MRDSGIHAREISRIQAIRFCVARRQRVRFIDTYMKRTAIYERPSESIEYERRNVRTSGYGETREIMV
jgi:hypothetical protein